MMSTDISLRENYVNTLFELAAEGHAVTTVKEDLDVVAAVIKQENDLVRFLRSPYFSRQSKWHVVTAALSGSISKLTLNFLMVLIKHDRVGLLTEIVRRYEQLWDAANHRYHVKVTLAHPLEPGEAEELTTAIGAAAGGAVRLEWAVDPEILGGAVIRCGDKLIDNSVHYRLRTAVKTIMSQVKGRN
jgi:F-type H+-transporting ATPase subunit delta